MGESIYVTGTDTGVGKTLVSVALVAALRARGLDVAGMKPVASGCAFNGQVWANADALALQSATSPPVPEYSLVNPFALPEATAPEIAAALADVQVTLQPIDQAFRALAASHRAVVVEGVGGWMAPLAVGRDQAELVHRLGPLPVVLVVGLRLGCINHARLSARAIGEDGLELVGWVASAVDPELAWPEQTLEALRRELPAPCLGVVPHLGDAPGGAERYLDLTPWLGREAPAGPRG